MKIDTDDGTVTKSNLGGDDIVKMMISPEAMKHVTKMLTTLYNDPESAVFREYLANAVDAHTAAGISAPAHVFLPTDTTPMFTVVDRGVGMSPTDLRETFSQWGVSTKNESDDEIGGFGLGCKSGLALASQFTVVSTKDGERSTAIVSNTTDGISTVNLVDIRDTDEENGTSVAIPIKNVHSFRRKALDIMLYTPTGMVLINGEDAPVNYREDFSGPLLVDTEVADYDEEKEEFRTSNVEIFNSNSGGPEGVVLTMGGIRYMIPDSDILSNVYAPVGTDESDFMVHMTTLLKQTTVLTVPIGSVKLSPQREGIQFNERTTKFFSWLIHQSCFLLAEEVRKSVDESDTLLSAWVNYLKYSEEFSLGNMEWYGTPLRRSGSIYFDGGRTILNYMGATTCKRTEDATSYEVLSGRRYDNRGRLPIINLTLITGVPEGKEKAYSRYVGAYAQSIDASGSAKFILCDSPVIFSTVPSKHWKVSDEDATKGDRILPDSAVTTLEHFKDSFDKFNVVDFETVKEAAIQQRKKNRADKLAASPRAEKSSTVSETVYAFYFKGNIRVTADSLSSITDTLDGKRMLIIDKNVYGEDTFFHDLKSISTSPSGSRTSTRTNRAYDKLLDVLGYDGFIGVFQSRSVNKLKENIEDLMEDSDTPIDISLGDFNYKKLLTKFNRSVKGITEEMLLNYETVPKITALKNLVGASRLRDKDAKRSITQYNKVKDSMIIEFANLIRNSDTSGYEENIQALARGAVWYFYSREFRSWSKRMENLYTKRYPLLDMMFLSVDSSRESDDVVLYMNAVYKSRKDQEDFTTNPYSGTM